MTGTFGRGSREAGTFLLADISGYTSFLQGVTNAHRDLLVDVEEPPAAYAFVSSLLDAMVESVVPPFRLVKFEGDALFALASVEELSIRGAGLLDCLRSCHAAFERRLETAHEQWTCECNSCIRIRDLSVKFILHHGAYFTQRIAGSDELAGPDVIVAHRLLKNHARDLVGQRPYALLSDAALEALDVPADGMVATTETYEELAPVPVHVLAL